MKCIKETGSTNIKRVSDEEAAKKVKAGWEYCPKSGWKVERGTSKPTAKKGKAEIKSAEVAEEAEEAVGKTELAGKKPANKTLKKSERTSKYKQKKADQTSKSA